MIDFENKINIDLDISLLEQIAADICGKDFELIITDNQDKRVFKAVRGHNRRGIGTFVHTRNASYFRI